MGRNADPGPLASPVLMPEVAERASPGVAALFDRINPDGSHAVLDLGPSISSSFGVYGSFARWIRFADLLPPNSRVMSWEEAFEAIPANAARPFNLVLAWDIFDHIPVEARPALVARLCEVTSPEATVLAIAGTGDVKTDHLRFSLVAADRMRYERTGHSGYLHPPILPAEMAQLLAPFHIVRAFSSRVGFREYVAARGSA